MKLTKFSHSCIRLEKDGQVLVFDPGNFSEAAEALQGADYVLITHEHPDHLDPEPVHAFLADHPEVILCAPDSVASTLREQVSAPERIRAVHAEERFELGPFSVRTYGGQHALIHPLVPMVQNIGYLVDEDLYHPGDSFVVPHQVKVKTLLVPIHAPWNKIQEVIDFLASVRPTQAFPIHDALLAENGQQMLTGHLARFGATYGTVYRHLTSGDVVDL